MPCRSCLYPRRLPQSPEFGDQQHSPAVALGLFRSRVIDNTNDQLYNQYGAIKGASIRAIAKSYVIDKFYPEVNQHFSLRNVLLGLGTSYSLTGGFVPSIAPVVAGAGAVLPQLEACWGTGFQKVRTST